MKQEELYETIMKTLTHDEALAMVPSQKISQREILAARTPAGGWTRAQLAEWGVPWPPPRGWKQKLQIPEPSERTLDEEFKAVTA